MFARASRGASASTSTTRPRRNAARARTRRVTFRAGKDELDDLDGVRLDYEPDSGAHGLGRTMKIHRGRRVLDFEPARKFVWFLALRSKEEYEDWALNSRRGAVFIPREPEEAYADAWRGWDDWLGLTVNFETARAWARRQGFKSQKDWWARTSELPHRIPERPGFYYRGRGWKGYADFLGLEEGSDDGDASWTEDEDEASSDEC